MKTIFLCLMFTFCTTLHFAQVTEEWLSMYTVEWGVIAEATVMDDEGNVYITGTGHNVIPLTGDDFYTLKYNSAGILQWDATYNGTSNGFDFGKAISVDPLGNVYVAGESPGVINGLSSGKDYLTIKYDSQGNELWVQRYNGNNTTGYNFDSPVAIETDEFGNVYVTGQSVPDGATSGAGYFCTVKYSTDGDFQWARYNLGQSGVGYSVKVSASGNVYVFGYASGDFITIKYNSSGVQQWAKSYSGFSLLPAAMKIDANENVYVTGNDGFEIYTVKYNSAGDSIWAAIITGSQSSDLAVDGFGNVYVTGRSFYTQGNGTEYMTVKYNTAGQELWSATYDGFGDNQIVSGAKAIALDAAGNVYVTGKSQGNGDLGDYATVKYNSDGIEQWAIRYHRPPAAIETAIGVHVSSNQEVYVSGNSISSGASPPYAIITIKYSQGTTLTLNAQAGSQVLEVVSTNGFSIGDQIVINPGGLTEETNTITGFGSILLQTPLQFDHLSGEQILITINTGVEEIFETMAEDYFLQQNFPNPFNPSTKIRFSIVDFRFVSLKVYDVLGKEVTTLVNEKLSAGTYEATFDASGFTSGIYFYKLEAGSFVETKKMILMK